MRTYLVTMATPDFRDRYDAKVKAHNPSEATQKAVAQEGYLSAGCRLARETKKDQQLSDQINNDFNRLRKLQLKRARLYHQVKDNSALQSQYERLKGRIRLLKKSLRLRGELV